MIARACGIALLACGLAATPACSQRKDKQAQAAPSITEAPITEAVTVPSPAASPIASEAQPVARKDRDKPRLRLSLRSTPAGATAAVDGRQVGDTPLVHEMEEDGRVHEFTFVKTGYVMERYKFQPVRDGVIHAPLRPLSNPPDAGPPPR